MSQIPSFIVKDGPEEMDSKTCQKMHLLLPLNLLRFPPKKAKCVVSARKSWKQQRQQRIPVPVPPLSKKANAMGNKLPVPMNLPFLAVEHT